MLLNGIQFRQPSTGIKNIGIVGSVTSSQMRLGTTSGPQQPRPGLPPPPTPISSASQMPGSHVSSFFLLLKAENNLLIGLLGYMG
jgi:transcription initiation factor TFIID subunit 12